MQADGSEDNWCLDCAVQHNHRTSMNAPQAPCLSPVPKDRIELTPGNSWSPGHAPHRRTAGSLGAPPAVAARHQSVCIASAAACGAVRMWGTVHVIKDDGKNHTPGCVIVLLAAKKGHVCTHLAIPLTQHGAASGPPPDPASARSHPVSPRESRRETDVSARALLTQWLMALAVDKLFFLKSVLRSRGRRGGTSQPKVW